LLDLLDSPAEVPGWRWSARQVPLRALSGASSAQTENISQPLSIAILKLSASKPTDFVPAIKSACYAIIAAEPGLTRFDSIAGDGDCGLTLKAGAEGVLQKIGDGTINGDDVIGSIIAISGVAEAAMGGTSGALYSIFFSALARALSDANLPEKHVATEAWAIAVSSALDKLYTYTRARPPSRTLIDPLAAFADSFVRTKTIPGGFADAVRAAAAAAENTRNLDATAGRSAYVERERLKNERIPDPGAWGVKLILESLAGF